MTTTLRTLIIILSSIMIFSNFMGLIVLAFVFSDGFSEQMDSTLNVPVLICIATLISGVFLLIGSVKSKRDFLAGRKIMNLGILAILILALTVIIFYTILCFENQNFALILLSVLVPIIFSTPFLMLYFHLNKIKRHKIE